MKSEEIRQKFLDFFETKKHAIYPSSSLVPDDLTMLLTTAGMVQFKPFFKGEEKPKDKRIATSQKCARTTDIDRVGHTARHLTFFEMLGNFSFGDYYKKDSIIWAWELLTEIYKLDKRKLWATIFTKDDEAFEIWERNTDIDKSRIARLGSEHNFWRAGDVGPCGPSSEIIYDFGKEYSCGPKCTIGCDCDRWLEIWNLVFMQNECLEDGSLKDLPKKNIDTGMGLERIAAILQNAKDNFHTDLLKPILDYVSEATKTKLGEEEKKDVSLKIITDHVRAVAFLIADGVIPSNEGRGYVLRRLMRRSIRHTWFLGEEKPLLEKFLKQVIKLMSKPYPELEANKDYILRIAKTEEERFSQTLKQGIEIIGSQIKQLKKSNKKIINGDIAFKLHDTYGFPIELTAEIAAENNLSISMAKFKKLMDEQKNRARAAWKEEEKDFAPIYNEVLKKANASEFVGYKEFKAEAKIVGLVVNQQIEKEAKAKQQVEIILDKTPFYAEKGGQVTDTGKIFNANGLAEVREVRESLGELIVHKAVIKRGSLKVGQKVSARIDEKRRKAIMRAHSATHILHFSLRSLLGTHVKQAGSLVEPDRLRFDFTHFEALTSEQLIKIEDMVNEKILASYPVRAYTTTLEYAREIQAIAFFGEKYGDFVRVIEAGDFSKELCGGTHVSNTGCINLFKIKSEGSVGSNLRRIDALTGSLLFSRLREDEESFSKMNKVLKVARSDLVLKVISLNKERSKLVKELEKAKKISGKEQIEKIMASAKSFDNLKVITYIVEGAEASVLRNYSDILRDKLVNSVAMLGTKVGGKALLIASASKKAVSNGFNAADWLNSVLPLIEGRGGGKPQLAQAGGKKPEKLSKALEKALDYASNWAKKWRTGGSKKEIEG